MIRILGYFNMHLAVVGSIDGSSTSRPRDQLAMVTALLALLRFSRMVYSMDMPKTLHF